MDKCPKCGANRKRGEELEFDCGTYLYSNGDLWYQHELCETRCDLAAANKELAELKERHGKLVEAAKIVERTIRCNKQGCKCSLVQLREILESEVKQ